MVSRSFRLRALGLAGPDSLGLTAYRASSLGLGGSINTKPSSIPGVQPLLQGNPGNPETIQRPKVL